MAVTVFVVLRDLPPSGGARTASPPRLHMLAGGAVRVRRQVFVSRFSWKERGGPASDGFCRMREPSAKRGVLVRPGPPSAGISTAPRQTSGIDWFVGVCAIL